MAVDSRARLQPPSPAGRAGRGRACSWRSPCWPVKLVHLPREAAGVGGAAAHGWSVAQWQIAPCPHAGRQPAWLVNLVVHERDAHAGPRATGQLRDKPGGSGLHPGSAGMNPAARACRRRRKRLFSSGGRTAGGLAAGAGLGAVDAGWCGMDAAAAMRSACCVRSSDLKAACRRVAAGRCPQSGSGPMERLQPGKPWRAKTELLGTQRLTMKKPRNGLEKTNPLWRLDLRRNCRPNGRARGPEGVSGERTQPAGNKRLTASSGACFSPNRSGEQKPNPAGRISIKPSLLRACDANREGVRP